MKKIHVVSLGCPKNRVDSEVMIGRMQGAGYQLVSEPDEADVLIVNTCAFIESAKKESIDTIFDLAQYKEDRSDRKLIVTGCMAQRYGDELQGLMPEVDLFLGTNEFQRINEAIGGSLPERTYISQGSYLYEAGEARVNSTRGGTAYLKISEGCNRTCSFCIIPKIRGKQVSRGVDDVLAEARMLGRAGVKEVALIAQDLTSYGVDFGDKRALAKLLRGLEDVPGIEWVRMLYMYPWNFTDELLEILASGGKVLPYVDMPLQHISDHVLKAMRRNVQRHKQEELIRRLRDIPNLVLRTTFITGFPGETDADFEALCQWVKEVEFDRVGVFSYSQEEDTEAATMPDQVEEHVREERRDALMEIQQEISAKKARGMIGKRLRVLVDGVSEEHEFVYEGRHYGQAPDIDGVVFLSYEDGGEPARPGEFVEVEISDSAEYDLVGVVIPQEMIVLRDGEATLSLRA
jgi:ribosomal protein S12 methylthiotransferase